MSDVQTLSSDAMTAELAYRRSVLLGTPSRTTRRNRNGRRVHRPLFQFRSVVAIDALTSVASEIGDMGDRSRRRSA